MKLVSLRSFTWRYFALAWALCLIIWFVVFDSRLSSAPVATTTVLNKDKLISLFTHFHHRNAKLATIDTRSAVYDELYDHVNLYDFLKKNSIQDRCMLYFNHLSMSDPEWLVNPHAATSYDRAAFRDFDSFKNEQSKLWNEEAKKAESEGRDPPPKLTEEQLREKFENLRQTTLTHEQTLHDFVSHVRVFEKCFMHSQDSRVRRLDNKFIRNQQEFLKTSVKYEYDREEKNSVGRAYKHKIACKDIEQRIFPFMSMEYPLFERWDQKKVFFPGADSQEKFGGCFLNDFKSRINGKGIVMTLGNGHIEDAARLIRVLRYFRNTYPIQIIFHNNLSLESRYNLIKAGRNDYMDLPRQDIWFVNAERAINEEYRGKFSGFANKIMAIMFSSFEDILFLDADSVIMKDVDYFFNLKRYVQTGTFFYKDRSSFEFRPTEDKFFFKKLLPSIDDSMVFNIPQTTNYSLMNEFFENDFNHYMESGTVVLNKKKHFMMPFMMAIMGFYNLVNSRIYGDKELFWLACALLGDETYAFNENFAAATGELTPEYERHKDINEVKSFHSKEICSNHPSHISDEDNSLVWINSGFRFCGNIHKKKMDIEKEFGQKKRYTKFKTLKEFKTFFESKLKIRHAIIPPYYKDHRRALNSEHEPEVPWVMVPYCQGYCWCAYSLIGGYNKAASEDPSSRIEGRVIEFSEEDQKFFEAIGDVWMSPLD